MKKLMLLMSFLCEFVCSSYGFGNYTTVSLKVGESYSLSANNFNTAQTHMVSGEAITVSYVSNSPMSCIVFAVKPGTAFFSYYDKCVLFQVEDVIPNQIDINVGENYTYSPIIGKGINLTWSSNNTSVATVNGSGVVTTVAPGKTTITCTSTNGIKVQSIVTVSPLLLSDVTLDKQSHEMSVGDNVQLTTSYTPTNATTKAVKWMSGNDNVAQVDNKGNVTAIAPGYCSIYAIASDGSGKFDKCLIHVTGTGNVKGDINGDGGVTPQDASMILQYIAKKITW